MLEIANWFVTGLNRTEPNETLPSGEKEPEPTIREMSDTPEGVSLRL